MERVQPFNPVELEHYFEMLKEYENGDLPPASPFHKITLRLIATIRQYKLENLLLVTKHKQSNPEENPQPKAKQSMGK